MRKIIKNIKKSSKIIKNNNKINLKNVNPVENISLFSGLNYPNPDLELILFTLKSN